MKERLLHYIWQHKLFNLKDLTTTQGLPLQILDFGQYNTNGGPDFLNARIKMENVVWAGNIEIHVHASDWKLHQHGRNRQYDTTILHVVYFDDDPDIAIPTLQLNGRIPMLLAQRYDYLMHSSGKLHCAPQLPEVDQMTINAWKERMLIQRLERKSDEILDTLKTLAGDWDGVAYRLMGKYFGSHINKEPFEQLTTFLDYKILLKHQDNPLQLEALMLGVAGFLNKDFVEVYPRTLKQEYLFLKQKYQLHQMQEHRWNFLRIRPVSFPTIRLAWFAGLMQQMPLMTRLLEWDQAEKLLETIEVDAYWETHYVLDKLSPQRLKTPGKEFTAVIMVNVVAPLLYAYGKYTGDEIYVDRALEVLDRIEAEHNSKLKLFTEAGWQVRTAGDAQACLELLDQFCQPKRCLECALGHKILQRGKSAFVASAV